MGFLQTALDGLDKLTGAATDAAGNILGAIGDRVSNDVTTPKATTADVKSGQPKATENVSGPSSPSIMGFVKDSPMTAAIVGVGLAVVAYMIIRGVKK